MKTKRSPNSESHVSHRPARLSNSLDNSEIDQRRCDFSKEAIHCAYQRWILTAREASFYNQLKKLEWNGGLGSEKQLRWRGMIDRKLLSFFLPDRIADRPKSKKR